ncbi:carbon-nitrogen hydrolase family protein [Eubacterium pyruvativorans]|uniref:carbon-nitrogen hydrolase family protein n=1 Tax=Eubacterium pyruvativorans TaxID=155865 RepID=UPI00087FE667|nr:carbon-nitrogen hydrolase family protein [Eubacterium pyruvativorans]MCI5747245.1 carbon-nitrogen hydrolase family protein [Eubacterium pyruvativorans]MDD7685259.1 carbon-nitrogen hydrolase family protein [Eubacterium pyruvativorans]SDE72034.1 Predicted amidohydrolase [Eubacterium pyruvativorans]
MRIAQLQLSVQEETEKNLDGLERMMEQAASEKPDLVTAGEMFTCPYVTEKFPAYAEPEGGRTWQRLSALAAAHHVYLAAGSVPERDEAGRIYNTAYVFDREGRQIAKHRKVHLFDIYLENGDGYRESATLTPGDHFTVFDTEFGRIGVLICFDIRFAEAARIEADCGAKAILVPGAFNMTTGPAHWELSFRMRAVDNQVFMIGTSDARNPDSGYTSWGHSILTDPWGRVVGQMEEQEGYMIHDIDLSMADQIRRQLPILSARRRDLYCIKTGEGVVE